MTDVHWHRRFGGHINEEGLDGGRICLQRSGKIARCDDKHKVGTSGCRILREKDCLSSTCRAYTGYNWCFAQFIFVESRTYSSDQLNTLLAILR